MQTVKDLVSPGVLSYSGFKLEIWNIETQVYLSHLSPHWEGWIAISEAWAHFLQLNFNSQYSTAGNNGTVYLMASDGILEVAREVPITDALDQGNVLRQLSHGEKLEVQWILEV